MPRISRQEPRIDLADREDLLIGKPSRIACATLSSRSGVGEPSAARMRRGSRLVAAEAFDRDLVEAGEPGLQRTQRLLQGLLEGAADRHRLADRFHRGGEQRLGAGEFLEREARDLGDDIVDGRLERGRRAPPVMSFSSSSSV